MTQLTNLSAIVEGHEHCTQNLKKSSLISILIYNLLALMTITYCSIQSVFTWRVLEESQLWSEILHSKWDVHFSFVRVIYRLPNYQITKLPNFQIYSWYFFWFWAKYFWKKPKGQNPKMTMQFILALLKNFWPKTKKNIKNRFRNLVISLFGNLVMDRWLWH